MRRNRAVHKTIGSNDSDGVNGGAGWLSRKRKRERQRVYRLPLFLSFESTGNYSYTMLCFVLCLNLLTFYSPPVRSSVRPSVILVCQWYNKYLMSTEKSRCSWFGRATFNVEELLFNLSVVAVMRFVLIYQRFDVFRALWAQTVVNHLKSVTSKNCSCWRIAIISFREQNDFVPEILTWICQT